jgi:hypothetical protein
MIRRGFLILMGMSILACDANETAVVVTGVAQAAVTDGFCTFDPTSEKILASYLDTAASYTLGLPFVALNNLAEGVEDVGDEKTMITTPILNSVTPIRYSVNWECDNTAFSGGALIIPHFDTQKGFCLDQRSDQTPSGFFGFDVVPVAGAPIDPQTEGILHATVIPPEFGQHIDDAFEIATLADACCIETKASNCDGTGGSASCTELANIFAVLDRGGDIGLQVESDAPGEPSADILRFQPFAVFDGQHQATYNRPGSRNQGAAPAYLLRQKGVFQLITPDGLTVESSQTTHQVGVGRNLGVHSDACEGPSGITGICLDLGGNEVDAVAYCQAYGFTGPPCRGPRFDGCYNQ